jgi:hypothetical protein
MKAILEARMVAARIQGLAFVLHGFSALGEWIGFPSQGNLVNAMAAF